MSSLITLTRSYYQYNKSGINEWMKYFDETKTNEKDIDFEIIGGNLNKVIYGKLLAGIKKEKNDAIRMGKLLFWNRLNFRSTLLLYSAVTTKAAKYIKFQDKGIMKYNDNDSLRYLEKTMIPFSSRKEDMEKLFGESLYDKTEMVKELHGMNRASKGKLMVIVHNITTVSDRNDLVRVLNSYKISSMLLYIYTI